MGLLITVITINYITNILYLVIFCKYIKKLIQDRQIDYISNYIIVGLGTISNFRLSLLAYSKMFPKPKIIIENSSQLTPVHYICGISFLSTILILAAVGTMIYNSTLLSHLFMLSIDLLIIAILNIICSIWMIAKDKEDNYYETSKKYEL